MDRGAWWAQSMGLQRVGHDLGTQQWNFYQISLFKSDLKAAYARDFFFFTLFYFTVLYWFCHTLTWIHHGCTWVPKHELLSHLPPHIISLCTSPKHPVSCIKHRLAIRFLHDSINVSMPFSQIIPPSPSLSPSLKESNSVSLFLSRIQGHHYHLSKFHIYVLVYCIGVFLSGLLPVSSTSLELIQMYSF